MGAALTRLLDEVPEAAGAGDVARDPFGDRDAYLDRAVCDLAPELLSFLVDCHTMKPQFMLFVFQAVAISIIFSIV